MKTKRGLYGGLVRLHVLHHAAREPIFGQGIMNELAHHGYAVGPGTMYPVLHGLERDGYLKAAAKRAAWRNRRAYVVTAAGRRELRRAKGRVWELFRELFEEELSVGPLDEAGLAGKLEARKDERK